MKSSLYDLIRQKENRKILWISRFKLRFYSSFLFKPESEARIRTTIGEAPVLYDSTLSNSSVRQISAFLKRKGYYHHEVNYTEEVKKSNPKKIKVVYDIELGKPTKIAGIDVEVENKALSNALMREQSKSLLKKGQNFDTDILEKEQKRLVRHMQNEGYFFFSEDLLYFHADTLKEKYRVYLTYKLKSNPVKYFGDSVKVDPYRTYKIRNVIVRQNLGQNNNSFQNSDTSSIWGYRFLNSSSFTVRPKVVSRSIFHNSNQYYTLENHESTYRRLIGLNNYKYVNISYKHAGDSLPLFLDCIVSLSPGKPASLGVEFNLTNTGGIPGVNVTTSFLHRNIFKGAEALRFSLYTGLEAQVVRSDETIVENTIFNTVEVMPEVSLIFPKFLLPVDQNRFAKRFVPKTIITASYNFQRRPDYTRDIVNGGLIYSWKESKTKSHSIQPININQVKILKTDDFAQRLEDLGNASLRASYEDNFITSIMYNFVYNGQVINKEKSFQIFRANIELAGNLLSAFSGNFLNLEQDTNDFYLINGIPFAQFFRTYAEYIPHININQNSKLVTRTFVGVGIPFGNSISMPFVRSFYGGGTNGIRAWEARTLGPGSISNDSLAEANVDQIGDIKIEQNLEYRFNIVKYFEGAIFTDIGNIWVLDNPEFSEQANFQFSNLWRDLAIGGGLGLRFNFDYFVVRLDYAQRIKDPGAIDPYKVKFFYDKWVWNFAIGYPF